MATVYTAREFIDKLIELEKHKTLYVLGGFGLIANAKNKKRVKNSQSYNRSNGRDTMIDNASADTFFFDCIGMVKALLWGWCGDTRKSYGGAVYASNGVPDTNCEGMIKLCHDVSADFHGIVPGEFLYMPGHCGIYIGEGLVIECTPKWKNCVQYSYLGNIGCTMGHYRNWVKHGKLNYIDYSSLSEQKKEQSLMYTAKRGDTIAKLIKEGIITDKADFIKVNGLKYPYWLITGKEYRCK